MARRPERVLRFAWDPPAGGAVEPPEAEAEVGWSTGQRPAAQYLNAILNNYGQTLDFLRGPSLARWSRVALGSTLDDVALAIAADRDTADGSAVLRRLVAAGNDSTGYCVYVSRRGDTWTRYDNFPAGPAGEVASVYCDGYWWILFDDVENGYLLRSAVDGVVGNALDGANDWILAQTFTGGGGVDRGARAMAHAAYSAGVVRVVVTREAIHEDGGGESYLLGLSVNPATVTGNAPGASGRGVYCDVVAVGAYFLAISSYGDVVRAVVLNSSVWANVGRVTTESDQYWRLTVGDDGEVVAWKRNAADPTTTVFWRSTDYGETWNTVERGTAGPFAYLTDLVWLDGEWVATTTGAPYLWSSNDLVTWTRGRLPYVESDDQGVWALTYSEGAWVALRKASVLVSARAEDLAPGVWSSDPTPTILGNAGYLRGRRIDTAAPTDGQVLAYESSTGLLVWTTPSAGVSLSSSTPAALGVAAAGSGSDAARDDHVHAMPSAADVGAIATTDLTANGDLLTRVAGSPAPLAIGSSGQVLTVSGGAPVWAAAPAPSSLTTYDGTSSSGFTASAGSGGGTAAITGDVFEFSQTGPARHDVSNGYNSAVIYRALGCPGDFDVLVRIASMPSNAGSQAWLEISDQATGGTRYALYAARTGGDVVSYITSSPSIITTATSRFGSYTGEEWLRISVRGFGVSFYTGVGVAGARPTTWNPVGTSATSSAAIWTHVTLTLVTTASNGATVLQLDDLGIVDRGGGL